MESELMERLRQRQQEWLAAPEERREYSRQQFMNALQNFNSMVLYGKVPQGE
jgi:hypothetical protein